ncbi:MAG TPA: metalloregulator ArsR/SmtB family transcription factor [Candidatus Acidoferrales bacterium]|nr:metalloregulator ArsR/SmtB family transcription factor [Candidatus Acidoferrales bacterium]
MARPPPQAPEIVTVALQQHFAYHRNVNAPSTDIKASAVAAAIGEPARARMLYYLAGGHAHTSTELAAVAEVSASTASSHLQLLESRGLVRVLAQGRHRYYSLEGPQVAAVLEALSVLAGGSRQAFTPTTPEHLRAARSCYDHIAGSLGVSLHDRFHALGWLLPVARNDQSYDVTPKGTAAFRALGIDMEATQSLRRRFAFGCVDWSERRPHLGGALGAAVLKLALKQKWVVRDLDSRALEVTPRGRREMAARFGLASARNSRPTAAAVS